MPNKKLMSIVDAAGYAMVATDDMYAAAGDFQPEIAMRNGHRLASRAVVKAPQAPSPKAQQVEAWALWLRDLVWWNGRAAA